LTLIFLLFGDQLKLKHVFTFYGSTKCDHWLWFSPHMRSHFDKSRKFYHFLNPPLIVSKALCLSHVDYCCCCLTHYYLLSNLPSRVISLEEPLTIMMSMAIQFFLSLWISIYFYWRFGLGNQINFMTQFHSFQFRVYRTRNYFLKTI
jgi:hypothetical protein